MPERTRPCPKCGGTMAYRLGDYQCRACDYHERAASADSQDDDRVLPGHGRFVAPSPGSTVPERAPSPPPQPTYAGSLEALESRRTYEHGHVPLVPPKFDPAPTLGLEKSILIGVFFLKALVDVMAAVAHDESSSSTIVWSPLTDAFLAEGTSLACLALVIYLPWVPLKWGCASLSCLMGFYALAGLFLSAVFLPLSGLLMPGAPMAVGTGTMFLHWVVGLLNAGVDLWLASILYRDIHRLQV